MAIITAKEAYVALGKPDAGARSIIDRVRSEVNHIPEPVDGDPTGPPVVAHVNHGRWIGYCNGFDPRAGMRCLNAQFVHPDDHRFFCVVCLNHDNGGKWRPVTWPENKDDIELSLDGLPPTEQNWTPPPPDKQPPNRFTAAGMRPEDATFDLRTNMTTQVVVKDPTQVTVAAPIDSEGTVYVTRNGQPVSAHAYVQKDEVRGFPAEWFEEGDEVTIKRLEA